jgi:hypothetical protein
MRGNDVKRSVLAEYLRAKRVIHPPHMTRVKVVFGTYVGVQSLYYFVINILGEFDDNDCKVSSALNHVLSYFHVLD